MCINQLFGLNGGFLAIRSSEGAISCAQKKRVQVYTIDQFVQYHDRIHLQRYIGSIISEINLFRLLQTLPASTVNYSKVR